MARRRRIVRPRLARVALVATVLACAPAATLAQEDDAPLFLSVRDQDGSLRLRVGSLFRDQELTQALHSGLPLRIQIALELWKDGFFDRQRGVADFRASVLYDPLERRYRVATARPLATEVLVDSLDEVGARLEETFAPPLRPDEEGRFYYLGAVEVQTLSMSDLDELERWLQGDVSRSRAEEEEVGNVVGRGVRRVFVTMLRLPSRRFRVKTPTFRFPGGS